MNVIRGVRGAITVEKDDSNEIVDATKRLLDEIIEKNQIVAENVAQMLISVTDDILSTFPAKAVRRLDGWAYVPVMCTTEIPVPNSLTKCIRIMMTINTEKKQSEIVHVYLERAEALRPDLVNKK
jgi:chorismate mutase